MDSLALNNRIPDSVLPFPEGFSNQAKYILWKVIVSPFFLWGQSMLLKLGFLHHEGRQNFILGKLAKGRSLDDFLAYLKTKGFGNHFIAWKDDDQVVSVRLLDGFEWQYHLRVFNDGEVRGHYEYTPEAHAVLHAKEIGMEERREVFLNYLGNWVVPLKRSGK